MDYENELAHYGVKGMQWGIRKDSTGSSGKRGKKQSKEDRMSDDAKKVAALKKKKIYELSNDDIKTVNTRGSLEKKYKEFNPSTIATGLAFVTATAATIGTVVTLVNNTKQAANVASPIIKKMGELTIQKRTPLG